MISIPPPPIWDYHVSKWDQGSLVLDHFLITHGRAECVPAVAYRGDNPKHVMCMQEVTRTRSPGRNEEMCARTRRTHVSFGVRGYGILLSSRQCVGE